MKDFRSLFLEAGDCAFFDILSESLHNDSFIPKLENDILRPSFYESLHIFNSGI